MSKCEAASNVAEAKFDLANKNITKAINSSAIACFMFFGKKDSGQARMTENYKAKRMCPALIIR